MCDNKDVFTNLNTVMIKKQNMYNFGHQLKTINLKLICKYFN